MSPRNARGGGEAAMVTVLAATPEAHESAAAQVYPRVEVILLESGEAEEPLAALAAGLERAEGEFVVHLRPGDVLLPGAVRKLAAVLAAQPTISLVYPAFRLLRDDGADTGVVPDEMSVSELFRFQYSPVGPGAMFRRASALEALGRPPVAPAVAELAFWVRLAASGGSRRLHDHLATRSERAEGRSGGLPAARAQLALHEQLLVELEPLEASADSRRAGARSACVLAAMEFGDDLDDPRERFFVADRLAEPAGSAASDPDAEIAALEARTVDLEQRLTRQRAVLPLLEEIAKSRERRLLDVSAPWRRTLRRRLLGRLRGGRDG